MRLIAEADTRVSACEDEQQQNKIVREYREEYKSAPARSWTTGQRS